VLSTTGASGTSIFETSITNEAGGTVTIGAADSRAQSTNITNSGTLQVTDGNELTLYGGSTLTDTSTGTIGVAVNANTSSASGIAGAGVTLDGTLAVTTIGSPTVGSTFTPITGPVTGTFAALSSAPWDYSVSYPSAAVVLTLEHAHTTIVQGPPTTGSTTITASAGFTDTLSAASGYVGSVTYNETGSVPAGLLVDTGGHLTTTGQLAATSYTVSGTNADAYGDTGTFTYTLTVNKTSQTITFTSSPASPTVGVTYTVTATGGGSGNPVIFSIDATTASNCSISASTVTFLTTGNCTIDANQAGNADYSAASQAQQTVTGVAIGSQTITFTSSPVSPTAGGTYTVTATGGGSGNPVTFSSATTSTCTVTGSTVSFIGAGACTIDANQAGNDSYAAAPTASQTSTVQSATKSSAATPSPSQVLAFTGVKLSGLLGTGVGFIMSGMAILGLRRRRIVKHATRP
jgi:hypothetical protein